MFSLLIVDFLGGRKGERLGLKSRMRFTEWGFFFLSFFSFSKEGRWEFFGVGFFLGKV